MEIYNPNGFNLPPIMIEKRKYRINIEEDQKVKNFINTKLLLNNDFNKLYFKTLEKSKAVAFYFNILEYNYWLEFAIDYILKRKKLITLVGYEILGNSGVCHEIDNIAYCPNENYRFFCECKNSEVKESDIFIFSGKMIDIGGNKGYIFTTSENVSDEIKRLARSKNIDIIENVLNKDLDVLLNEIKEG